MKSEKLNNAFLELKKSDYFEPFSKFSYHVPDYEVGKNFFRTKPTGQIAGFNVKDFSSIDDIYDLIHPSDVDKVFAFSVQTINFVNEHVNDIWSCKSEIVFRARIRNGKSAYLLRRCMPNGAGS